MDKLKNLIKSDTPREESSTPKSQGTSGFPTTTGSSTSGGGSTASMAGHENPYRASSLDPRVDGGKKTDAPIMSARTETPSYGSSQQYGSSATGQAPSSLTSTANPMDRSAEYGHSTNTRGLDHATPSTTTSSSYPATSGTTGTTGTTGPTGTTGMTGESEQPSMIGSALGAVGLGSLAGSLGYGTGEHENTSTTRQPTTTTGVDSYTSPTHQGSSDHNRRESIPTSAYPAGADSPRAVNAPIGGTRTSADQGFQQTGHGHPGTGIGAGSSTYTIGGSGHNEHEKSQALRENLTGETPSTTSTGHSTGHHHQGGSSAVSSSRYDDSRDLRSNILSGSNPGHTSSSHTSSAESKGGLSSGVTPVHNAITTGDEAPITSSGLRDASVIGHGILHPEGSAGIPAYSSMQGSGTSTSTGVRDESHTGRNVALGGAAATAAGVGAHHSHEHRHGAESSGAPYGSTQETGKFTSTPLRDQGYTSARDPTIGGVTGSSEPYGNTQGSGKFTSTPMGEQSHTGRNAALGGAAATAVGAGAYGAHEHSGKYEAKEQAAHQKELEKAERAHEKEFEKEHKREEKAHAKEVAAMEKQHTRDSHHAHEAQKEKKPSIFGRIFKKRQNKDTGVEEEYSTDEEDHGHHKGAIAGAGVAGATGAAVAHERTTAGHTSTAGEGYQKPSYNPFAHDNPSRTTTTTTRPTESITGLPYDASKDPKTAESLRHHSHGTGMGSTTSTTGVGAERSTGSSGQHFDPIAAGSFKMGEVVDKKHGHEGTTHFTDNLTGKSLGDNHDNRGSLGTTGTTGTSGTGIGHDHHDHDNRRTTGMTGTTGTSMGRDYDSRSTTGTTGLTGTTGSNLGRDYESHGTTGTTGMTGTTGTGMGRGYDIRNTTGTTGTGSGYGYEHSGTSGTGTSTLPHRPVGAAPTDDTRHYNPSSGHESVGGYGSTGHHGSTGDYGSTGGYGSAGDKDLSTAQTYGSPTGHNVTAPGHEPQHLAAQEMQHAHETGAHDSVGTQLKDSFKMGGL